MGAEESADGVRSGVEWSGITPERVLVAAAYIVLFVLFYRIWTSSGQLHLSTNNALGSLAVVLIIHYAALRLGR